MEKGRANIWHMNEDNGRKEIGRYSSEEEIPAHFKPSMHMLLASDHRMIGGVRQHDIKGIGRARIHRSGQAFLYLYRAWYGKIMKEAGDD